jgi:predicted acyltransferase
MNRLTSLDVFRGATIAAMILVNNPGSWSYVYGQLGHAPWHGATFTDTIFPFFLFIVGVAIVFAFSKRIEAGAPKKDLYLKIIRRSLIIFALGIFLNGFPFYDFSVIRIPGVLQRIAICYFFASVIVLTGGIRWQVLWSVLLLFVYWAFMEFYPVPGVGAGVYEPARNFAAYIDNMVLSGHMWTVSKTWDPEGIWSTLPAISTTLFGVLTGHWLRSKKDPLQITVGLLLAGNAVILLGAIWGEYLPINKNIWTSSYSVFMAGLAMVCLAFCYYFIDIKGYKKFTQPFLVYGMNAIAVFVLSGIIGRLTTIIKVTQADGHQITVKHWMYENLFASWLGPMNGSIGYAISHIVLLYLLMLILYKKKIFIKI